MRHRGVCLREGLLDREQPRRERLRGAAQLGPGQRHRPGGGLDGDFPAPVVRAGTRILAGRGPLVTVPAEELSDLGLQRGLHEQPRAEAGDVLQDLPQPLVMSKQLVDVAADALCRGYPLWHGRRSFPSMTWRS